MTSTLPSASERRGRLSLSGAVVWFALSYGAAILGYLAINAFAARLLDAEFGYFVIAVTVSTLFSQLGLVGVHRGGLREAAKMAPGDQQVLLGLRRSARAVLLTVLPLTAIVTGACTYLVLSSSPATTRWPVAVGVATLVYLGGQQKLWANYLRGFGQVRFASLLEGRSGGALASVGQGLLLGLVLMTFPEWGWPGAIAAMALGFAVPVLIAWAKVHRLWRHVPASGRVWRDLTVAIRRDWRFASNMLGGYLNSTLELWLAAVVLTAADLSLFSAAQRLSILLAVPLVSLGVVFSPVVSRLAGQDDARLERLLRTGATLAMAVTAVIWIPILVAPAWVLGVVYGRFEEADVLLLVLTLGFVGNVVSGLCGTALTMSKHESVVARVQWVAVAMRVVLGSAAAVAYQSHGLAVSASAVTVCMSATLWWTTHRRIGLWTHPTMRPSLRLMRQTAG